MENMFLFLVIVIAVALLAQTVILLVFVVAFRNWCQRTGAVLDEMNRNAEPMLRAARELLAESKGKLDAITANVSEILQLTKNQVSRVDGLITDASDRARLQLIRLDQLASDTLKRFEETTEAIQRGVLAPVREIAAILAGVRTALDFLLRRNKRGVQHAAQDEELFI